MIARRRFTEEIGVENDAVLLLSVGELNGNKNHITVIKALSKLSGNIHYIISGIGSLKEELEKSAAELGVEARVHLLGYRTDVADILKSVDVFLLPSIREGLNMSLMEAMASGKPCICSDIRGNHDLITDGKGGYRVDSMNVNAWSRAIYKICENDKGQMGRYNAKIISEFSVNEVSKKMKKIYSL